METLARISCDPCSNYHIIHRQLQPVATGPMTTRLAVPFARGNVSRERRAGDGTGSNKHIHKRSTKGGSHNLTWKELRMGNNVLLDGHPTP